MCNHDQCFELKFSTENFQFFTTEEKVCTLLRFVFVMTDTAWQLKNLEMRLYKSISNTCMS